MRVGLSMVVAILASPAAAAAQGQRCDDDAAQAAYAAGIEHMRAARYPEAIVELERANQLCPDPRPVFKQCQCHEHQSDCAAAARCYERYFAACKGRPCPDHAAALQRQAKLLGELCGQVRATSEPTGAELLVDGAADSQTPRDLLLWKGRHTFAATLARHLPAERTVEIHGGANPDVVLPLRPPPTPPPPGCTRRSECLAGWITLGSGLAVAATGAVFSAKAYGAADDFDAADTRRAQRDASAAIDDNTTLAGVLYGVGGAAAATGVVLLLLDGFGGENDEESDTDSVATLAAAPGGFAGGFTISF